MKIFEKLLIQGFTKENFVNDQKIRITNVVALFSTLISLLYTFNYIFILENLTVAFINLVFTLSYFLTILINRLHAIKLAKIWFFSVLMVHLFVCTNLYVTKFSGFHLYYFLVPTGAFLLFNLEDKREKIALSFMSVALFFYCENTIKISPLIEVSDAMNHALYQSVVFINMIEVIFVLSVFVNHIERNERKLTLQATTDPLTGLYNRRYFFELGDLLINKANSDKRSFCVVILDFDHFKKINDQYGHFVGDLCLTQITQLMKELCRPDDIIARIGGEEFAIALPDTKVKEANTIIELLRLAIEKHPIPLDDRSHFNCTVSFGVSGKIEHDTQFKSLLIEADKALYEAKEQGRNRVITYDTIAN